MEIVEIRSINSHPTTPRSMGLRGARLIYRHGLSLIKHHSHLGLVSPCVISSEAERSCNKYRYTRFLHGACPERSRRSRNDKQRDGPRKRYLYKFQIMNFWQSLKLKFQDRRFRTLTIIIVGFLVVAGLLSIYYYRQKNLPGITFETGNLNLVSQKPASTSSTGSTIAEFSQSWDLKISRLNLVVPVAMDVDANNKDEYFNVLETGVAHMKGTAWPGEGNTVIFGHSSFYANQPGSYKTVFATLDKLQVNDQIVLSSQSEKFTYKVLKQEIVAPDRVDLVAPTSDKRLTLFTCWPPKTTQKRLVVTAGLVE